MYCGYTAYVCDSYSLSEYIRGIGVFRKWLEDVCVICYFYAILLIIFCAKCFCLCKLFLSGFCMWAHTVCVCVCNSSHSFDMPRVNLFKPLPPSSFTGIFTYVFSTDHFKVVPLLQFFSVWASVVSYMAFVLPMFVPRLSIVLCSGKVVIRG